MLALTLHVLVFEDSLYLFILFDERRKGVGPQKVEKGKRIDKGNEETKDVRR